MPSCGQAGKLPFFLIFINSRVLRSELMKGSEVVFVLECVVCLRCLFTGYVENSFELLMKLIFKGDPYYPYTSY